MSDKAPRGLKMNAFDKVIATFSPLRGVQRARARAEMSLLMNYDGATPGRRAAGWKAPATDADAASAPGRARLRNLSRDMVRNNWIATRGQAVVRSNVVGSGIKVSIDAKTQKATRAVEKHILPHLKSRAIDFAGDLNIYGMQKVVMNTVFESGEILVRKVVKSKANGGVFPLKLQLLEVDHLDPNIFAVGENEVIDGIEYDPSGRVVAYHILRQHPGGLWRKFTAKSDRIPANDILHIRDIARAGQGRGVPWLAPVMINIGDLRDYQDSQQLKQKMSAMLAAVITHMEGTPIPKEARGLEDLSAGSVVNAPAGSTITWSDPPSVGDFGVTMRLGVGAVAMGIGITAESLSGDLSGVNFSSGRMGRIEMDANVSDWQENIIIDQFCNGVEKWIREVGGLVPPLQGLEYRLKWTAPRRALIDPTKEIPATIKKIGAGLSSVQREIRALGGDPEEIHKERLEDAERTKEFPAPDPTLDPGVNKIQSKQKTEVTP